MANVDNVRRAIFDEALRYCEKTLAAERAMIVYHGFGAVRGLDAPTLWLAGAISTTLMQTLLEEKEPMVMIDATEDSRTRDQTSAILSSLRSVLFFPLKDLEGRVVGLLYADHRHRAGAFDSQRLATVTRYVDDILSPQLLGAWGQGHGEDLDWDGLLATRWL